MAYRFNARYRAYCNSLDALAEAKTRDKGDSFVLSGTSAKFSITFELAWKLMKDVLIEYYEVSDFVAGSPRETLRASFRLNLIEDDRWMQMLKLRNQLSHDYNLVIIEEAFDIILSEYLPLFYKFREKMEMITAAADAENEELADD